MKNIICFSKPIYLHNIKIQKLKVDQAKINHWPKLSFMRVKRVRVREGERERERDTMT